MLSYKPAVSWLKCRVKSGKGKRQYNNCIFKNCLRIGKSKVSNTILPFSLMLHIAEKLLCFNIFEVVYNKFEDNFVFAFSFPGKLSLFTMNWPFHHPALWTIQNIYYLNCINPSFLGYESWNALKLVFLFHLRPNGKFMMQFQRYRNKEML